MKKRIGIVTTWMERGAAYVSRQYADLLAGDYEVFIYARGGESFEGAAEGWDRYPVHEGAAPAIRTSTRVDERDFIRWLDRERLDAVIFNEQRWWFPVLWCRERGIKAIAYIDYYTEETIPFFAAYDALLCNTRRHLSAFSRHPGAIYLPWGTDVALFSPRPRERADGPEGDGRVVFFHSAGMNPRRKGTDILLDAFSRLGEGAFLLIHSQVGLAERIPGARSLIERLEGEGRLRVVVDTVPAPGLYHLGDVYVYPSRLDGIGLSLAEALACGLPAIASDFPPMNEFLEPSCCRGARVSKVFCRADGYYWPQCEVDPESLAEQMRWYVARRSELPSLKEKARRFAETDLDWASRAPQLSGALEAALAAAPRPWSEAAEAIRKYEWARLSPYNKLVERNAAFRLLDGARRLSRRIRGTT